MCKVNGLLHYYVSSNEMRFGGWPVYHKFSWQIYLHLRQREFSFNSLTMNSHILENRQRFVAVVLSNFSNFHVMFCICRSILFYVRYSSLPSYFARAASYWPSQAQVVLINILILYIYINSLRYMTSRLICFQ